MANLLKYTFTLDKDSVSAYNNFAFGVWRSLVSRLVRDQEASGSNPDTPTKNPKSAFAGFGFFISCFKEKGPRLRPSVD